MHKVFIFLFIFAWSLSAKHDVNITTSYYTSKDSLSLEQIKHIKDFIPSEGKNFGILNQEVWLKIDILNNEDKEFTKIFRFTFPYMDDIRVYTKGNVELYGHLNNYNTHINSIDNNVFKVKIHPFEKQVIFVKIVSSFAIQTDLEHLSEEEYINKLFFQKSIFSFCYGIIFSLLLYNFFVWISIRKKEFLYYILYHGALFLGIISWSGFGFQYIWPTYPSLNYYSYGVIANLIFGFQILFIVHYLNMQKVLPKITTFLKYFSFVFFFFSFSSIFLDTVSLYEILSLISTLSLLFLTLYVAYIKKSILALYIFMAELILVVGNLLLVFSDFGIIEGSFSTHYFYVWGTSIEALLMSFALSYKYNELKKQKNIVEQMLINKHKLSSIGENFNNLVHQFRQPLSQINSIVYLLYSNYKNGKLTHQVVENNLDQIESQTAYLSKTLEYFRNFTADTENITTFSLAKLMEKSETILHYILKNNAVTLEKNFDKALILQTNETQFLQIISVIITNASDAFIKNNTQEPIIRIKAFKENDTLHISISNNAGAIDPSLKDTIFEPYVTTKQNAQGSGLGLYIVKQIIENKLHASINVECHKEWTSFIMRIRGITKN